MMLKYLRKVNVDTLESVSNEVGYVKLKSIKDLSYQKTENTSIMSSRISHFWDYHFIVKDIENNAYYIEYCPNNGDNEYTLYIANIYMNYLREFIDGNIQILPDIEELKTLIYSKSSCFEPGRIKTEESKADLKEYLEKSNFSKNLGILEIISSEKFDYNIINDN